MHLEPVRQTLGLRRLERLVQRPRRVRVQIVLHQHDHLGIRVHLVRELAEAFGIILPRPSIRHLYVSLPGQWLEDHEQIRHAVANVLVVVTSDLPWSGRHGRLLFADQLLARLVQAHYRTGRIIRPLVHLQHVFHLPNELGVGLRWNAPLFAQPRLEFIFFSVRRTVSFERASTYSKATIRSASSRSVQRLRPSGAWLQASATRWASPSPSSVRR